MNQPLDPRNPKDRQALDELNRDRNTGTPAPQPKPPVPPKPKVPAKPTNPHRSRFINLQLFKLQVETLGRVDLKMKLGSTEPEYLLGLWNMLKNVIDDLETENQCAVIVAIPEKKKEKLSLRELQDS